MDPDESAVRASINPDLSRVHVLYLGHDVRLVTGAERMFSALRVPWRSSFSIDPDEAWSIIAGGGVHVLVSDVPDGGYRGSLLEQVAEQVPHIVRLALVDRPADRRRYVQAGWSHQALLQPCDADSLVRELTRCAMLASLLINNYLSGLLAPLSDLPTSDAALQAIWRELSEEDPDLDRLTQNIRSDAALAARLLRLANAPAFGAASSVTDIRQAVVLLGLNRLRSLVLYLNCFAKVDPELAQELHLERWHQRSLGVGLLAHAIAIAENTTPMFKEQAGLLGVLQDIGILALATVEPERYRASFPGDPHELAQREFEAFGVDHASVGAFLLGLWNLPLPVVEAIRWHHRGAPGRRSDFDLSALLHIANGLYEECEQGRELIDPGFLERMDKGCRLETWRALAYDCFDG